MSGNNDLIGMARGLGCSIAGSIGGKAYEETELSFASRLLPRFLDDPITRVRINILLYWKAGYYKSSLLKVFSETIPLETINITSMTLQKIFGSIDPKTRRIVLPAFTNNVHFVSISELTALLGQRDMKEFSNVMNQVLEGEEVHRQTITLGTSNDDITEFERCGRLGVKYDPEKGELSYKPDVCVLAASRPLDNHYFNYLFRSGHMGRYHVVQQRISDELAAEHTKRNYLIDSKSIHELRKLNEALAKCKVGQMKRPPESLTNETFDQLSKMASDEIAGRRDLSLSDVLTPRIKDDILRELVSHAFLRTASQNGFTNIDELQYTAEDVAYVKKDLYHFIDFPLDPLIAPDFVTTRAHSKRELAKIGVLKILGDGLEHSTADVIIQVTRDYNVKSAETVYNAIRELEKEGRIEHVRQGFIRLRTSGVN